jgi:hypothetical protein
LAQILLNIAAKIIPYISKLISVSTCVATFTYQSPLYLFSAAAASLSPHCFAAEAAFSPLLSVPPSRFCCLRSFLINGRSYTNLAAATANQFGISPDAATNAARCSMAHLLTQTPICGKRRLS